MSDFTFKRGLDVPISGAAQGAVIRVDDPASVAVTPPDYKGNKMRLAVKVGARVEAGQPLGYAKTCPQIKFVSPAAGEVVEIRRGHRRAIEAVVVACGAGGEVDHGAVADIAALGADGVKARLLAGGLWPLLRSKPLAGIADPDVAPVALLVSAHQTGPNCADPQRLLEGREKELVAGFAALAQLAPVVHLCCAPSGPPAALAGISGLTIHRFSGPHPAGDPETQINFVCPPAADQRVWFCRTVDVADFGALLLSGKTPTRARVAVVGAVASPSYLDAVVGSPVVDLVAAAGGSGDASVRIVGGSVLTGRTLGVDNFLGQGGHTLSVIAEGGTRHFLGWLNPGAAAFSNHRFFLSALLPRKDRPLNTAVHGGPRALVPIGSYNRVVPSDIEPNFLMKAILCEDIEAMLALGLLEMSREEAALCTVVCPSKINYSEILGRGWAQYEKETA